MLSGCHFANGGIVRKTTTVASSLNAIEIGSGGITVDVSSLSFVFDYECKDSALAFQPSFDCNTGGLRSPLCHP